MRRQANGRYGAAGKVAGIALLLVLACGPACIARAAGEKELLTLWQQHLAAPTEHAAVIQACHDFKKTNMGDVLTPVADCLEAWHLLKLDRRADAVTVLNPYLTPATGSVRAGATVLARAWLSRMDLQRVELALKRYYREEICYPDTLADIPAHPRLPKDIHPPLTDRWGLPWRYELVPLKHIPNIRNQRYEIRSARLLGDSDLGEALALPYGAALRIKPLREVVSERGISDPTIEFEVEADPAHGGAGRTGNIKLILGKPSGKWLLAYVGDSTVIVCDRMHWKVFRKTGR